MKVVGYLAILVLTATASSVLACQCNWGQLDKAFCRSQAVFTGKVIRSGKSTWTVEVDRVWKGEVEKQIELFEANVGGCCSMRFKKGRSYLFLVNAENKDGKVRFRPQLWTTALKTTKIILEDRVIKWEDGEGAKWVEDWVLMGQGEGKPPLTPNR